MAAIEEGLDPRLEPTNGDIADHVSWPGPHGTDNSNRLRSQSEQETPLIALERPTSSIAITRSSLARASSKGLHDTKPTDDVPQLDRNRWGQFEQERKVNKCSEADF
jgi:hypothetical protein